LELPNRNTINQAAQTQPSKPPSQKAKGGFWRFALVGGLFFVLGVAVSYLGVRAGVLSPAASNKINLDSFWQANSILQQKFDGDIDPTKQSEGATAGMVASLGDPYTVFLDKKANQELANDLKGELSGVGIEIGIKNNKLVVIAPIDGGPAQKAGIKAGDYIVGIDGKDAGGFTLDEAVKTIRGEAGTQVKLTVIRGTNSPKEITITREKIQIPSVTSEIKDGNIGYIKIRRFGDDTVTAVSQAVSSLKSQGVKAVVIDVRDNPGGYLDGAIKISSQFMSQGVVVQEKSRHTADKSFSAISGGMMTDIPVIMLINGGSASASEIMAGALHDNNRATLVGEKTFGKGSVQEVVCLNGIGLSLGNDECKGDALKVTVAHWYTPNGINISKEGIKPDVEVKAAAENDTSDPQLQKALEVAKSKL
jgi:carboxyl-terminal processing protease